MRLSRVGDCQVFARCFAKHTARSVSGELSSDHESPYEQVIFHIVINYVLISSYTCHGKGKKFSH